MVNDYEAAYWAPFLWFHNLVLAYFRNGAIDTAMSVEMILKEGQTFLDGLTEFIALAEKPLPVGYSQLLVFIVWGNYYLTILCGHKDRHILPPFHGLLGNFFLLGLLFVSHKMLYPLSGDFALTKIFERNVRVCEVMLECPLTEKGRKEKEARGSEREQLLAQMEEKLRVAEEQREKLAKEKLEAMEKEKQAEKELKNAQKAKQEADEQNAKAIEKAKDVIQKSKEEAEKAKQELEKAHAEHLAAEEGKRKLAQEKMEAMENAQRAEKELENAHKAHQEADADNAAEIEKAKEAIERAKKEAEEARQEFEKSQAKNLAAEQERKKLAQEKLEAMENAQRAQKELENAQKSRQEADAKKADEITKAKEAIEKAKRETEKAREDLKKANAEQLAAELQREMLADEKADAAIKKKKFPNLLKKNTKRLPRESFVHKNAYNYRPHQL
jgi:hypothetical protein